MSKQFENMQKLAFGKILIKESMEDKKFTKKSLKAHIREMILDEAKKKKDKPEDVAPQEDVDINMDAESPEETPTDVTPPETSTGGDIDPTVKSINDSLQTALAQAKKLGDAKLVTQIGNTLTMLLRDNIIGQQNVAESLNENEISEKHIKDYWTIMVQSQLEDVITILTNLTSGKESFDSFITKTNHDVYDSFRDELYFDDED